MRYSLMSRKKKKKEKKRNIAGLISMFMYKGLYSSPLPSSTAVETSKDRVLKSQLNFYMELRLGDISTREVGVSTRPAGPLSSSRLEYHVTLQVLTTGQIP